MRPSVRHDPIVAFLVMFSVIIGGDILLVFSGNDGYPQPFVVISLLYVLAYLWVLFKSQTFPAPVFFITSFMLIKLYILVSQNYFLDMSLVGVGGDAESYHIPRALGIHLKFTGYLDYLFSTGGDYNGRLTHVLLSNYVSMLHFFGFDHSYEAIHNIAYFFNTMLCVITLVIYRQIIVAQGLTEASARRALWFLAFNPYFMTVTGSPQKEALLFFALAVFAFALVSQKNKGVLLLFSIFIIAMERIYMVPLLSAIILLFHRRYSLNNFAILIVCAMVFELFIGVDSALFMLESHSESLMQTGNSHLADFGFLNNLIRAYFGPFAFRNFLAEQSTLSMLANAHYFLLLFYPYIAIRASLKPFNFGMAIVLTLIFVAVLIPYHSSFKILMIVFFGGLFIAPLANQVTNANDGLKFLFGRLVR